MDALGLQEGGFSELPVSLSLATGLKRRGSWGSVENREGAMLVRLFQQIPLLSLLGELY